MNKTILTKNDIIRLIKDYLLKKDEIIFAYIFGSFAKKENYHDIDIAVFIKEQFDYKILIIFLMVMKAKL